jgi:hypothetical protein
VVFDSGVPLSVMPTLGVSSHLTTSREELAAHMDRNDPRRRPCTFAHRLDRDAVYADLFRRLSPR